MVFSSISEGLGVQLAYGDLYLVAGSFALRREVTIFLPTNIPLPYKLDSNRVLASWLD